MSETADMLKLWIVGRWFWVNLVLVHAFLIFAKFSTWEFEGHVYVLSPRVCPYKSAKTFSTLSITNDYRQCTHPKLTDVSETECQSLSLSLKHTHTTHTGNHKNTSRSDIWQPSSNSTFLREWSNSQFPSIYRVPVAILELYKTWFLKC